MLEHQIKIKNKFKSLFKKIHSTRPRTVTSLHGGRIGEFYKGREFKRLETFSRQIGECLHLIFQEIEERTFTLNIGDMFNDKEDSPGGEYIISE